MPKLPRLRRSCLAVPGSNPRFLEKAKGLDTDQVFLDLEAARARRRHISMSECGTGSRSPPSIAFGRPASAPPGTE
jgi:hypothetical protein